MKTTVERFTNRVENYVKYRPGYPAEVLHLFRDRMNLTLSSVIADIGSGTGISSRLFLENGNKVFGVEPNAAMRAAAEELLSEFSIFTSIDGTAENTNLPDNSVDFVIAAQAFHWFDQSRTLSEFKRILRPHGHIALMWNERQLDTTPFLIDYEKFLLRFADDYTSVRHDNVNEKTLAEFFQIAFHRATYQNVQVFDFEGIRGRVLSSSYMPAETSEDFGRMEAELKSLFAKHAESGKIKVFYNTNVFYAKV